MTAQYTLKAGNLTATTLAAAVGKSYNIGLSDGSHYYGYNLQNWGTQTKQRRLYGASVQDGFVENSDITTRGALTNFGSSNLVDRDLVYFPRVSQGDFSGGSLQTVAVDPTKYFDSDLEIVFPGYLQLRQQMATVSRFSSSIPTASITAVGNQFWASAGESVPNDRLYSFTNVGSLTTNVPSIIANYLCTDGYAAYYASAASGVIARWVPGVGETVVANTVNGTLGGLWVVENGTGQYFAYYINTAATPNALWKVDLSVVGSFPIAAGAHVQMPTGGMNIFVVDIVPYNNGVAILTAGSSTTFPAQVWYHDGASMTKIVEIGGYQPAGMVNCLGDLYVTAYQSNSAGGGAILAKISGGNYSIAADISPNPALSTSGPVIGSPTASRDKVYFAVARTTINGIASYYVGIYSTSTGAYSHSQATPTLTSTGGAAGHTVAVVGSSIGSCEWTDSTTKAFALTAQSLTTATYETSGWMVSSNFDFATPAIEKRFRTIAVHHAPLKAGESIKVNAYVDLDPAAFTTALTPTATSTNSTLNSTTTTLSFGANVGVGHMLYYALQLTAGTSNLTSPKVNYVTVEVGGTWVWDFDLDCSVKRRDLTQSHDDFQGVGGKDLYYLIRNAYENGTLLTLYLAEGVTYTVTIETVGGNNVAYMDKSGGDSPTNADDEWLCHVVLRQVA